MTRRKRARGERARPRPESASPSGRARVDQLAVAQGIARDLKHASALLLAGEILAGDQRLTSPGALLPEGVILRRRHRRGHRYVSRGGLKLEAALNRFAPRLEGAICLDLGMSTGGFTDCLLQHGASKVYGVDVGVGLADRKLTEDQRVVLLEGTNARALTPALLPDAISLCVADLSFTSLRRTIGSILFALQPAAQLLLLVKPQFELERGAVGAGGIVRDPAARQRACEEVAESLRGLGLTVEGWIPSPIQGAKGNQEYLLSARTPGEESV